MKSSFENCFLYYLWLFLSSKKIVWWFERLRLAKKEKGIFQTNKIFSFFLLWECEAYWCDLQYYLIIIIIGPLVLCLGAVLMGPKCLWPQKRVRITVEKWKESYFVMTDFIFTVLTDNIDMSVFNMMQPYSTKFFIWSEKH